MWIITHTGKYCMLASFHTINNVMSYRCIASLLQVELSFKSGDFITCYGEMDDDGFYMGEMLGRRGLVPSNFLQENVASDEEVLDSVSVVTPARSGESINTSDSRKSEKSEKIDHKVGHLVTCPVSQGCMAPFSPTVAPSCGRQSLVML